MTYRIDFSSVAKAEADAAFLNLSQFTKAERAQIWYQGLINAIVSLQEMPRRYDICTVQELLGHKDVKTTMIYTHVLNRGGKAVRSPLDA